MRTSCLISRRARQVARVALLASVAALSGIVLAQGNLAFLKHAPVTALTDADRKLVEQAITSVLHSPDQKAAQTWQNTESGNSGKVEAVSSFNTEDHRECRQLRISSHTKENGDGSYTMNACRAAGGRWLLDPDARPASG